MQRNQHDDLSINFDEWLRSRIGTIKRKGVDHAGAHGTDEARELRIALRAVELYADRHPRPAQVNQKQAAEMLGVSARTVHNMIKFGTLRLNRCGLIPIEEVDKLLAIGS
ncbi:helix-turn-helix domain-containing protein [Burkholderia sp. RF4-BP95]|uniref:helix-turn-helix domain-containing protein n=1 Tax=Burkholderia sp. RF4-BP95 TaxID=1637845 RepID=UPI000A5CB984|nr:helix-turn-helix domain-containing protein [Burkholderia sp. RF4-BP95]